MLSFVSTLFVFSFFSSCISAQECVAQSQTAPVSLEGQNCGAEFGVCAVGLCCSGAGFCGRSTDFCSVATQCQPAYGDCIGCPSRVGTCQSQPSRVVLRQAGQTCGAGNGDVCELGLCCSGFGFCGSGTDFCSAQTQCQSQWGDCDYCPARTRQCDSPIDNATASAGQPCGPGIPGEPVCDVGLCCSEFGFCGAGGDFCSTRCQSGFGDCNGCPARDPCVPQSRTGRYSREGGACGPLTGLTCDVGLCCSGAGFCGTGSDYCSNDPAIQCLPRFGDCDFCTARPLCPGQDRTLPVAQEGGLCGPAFGAFPATVCDVGLCCSAAGFCGTGPDFCSNGPASGCQQRFGDCDFCPPRALPSSSSSSILSLATSLASSTTPSVSSALSSSRTSTTSILSGSIASSSPTASNSISSNTFSQGASGASTAQSSIPSVVSSDQGSSVVASSTPVFPSTRESSSAAFSLEPSSLSSEAQRSTATTDVRSGLYFSTATRISDSQLSRSSLASSTIAAFATIQTSSRRSQSGSAVPSGHTASKSSAAPGYHDAVPSSSTRGKCKVKRKVRGRDLPEL